MSGGCIDKFNFLLFCVKKSSVRMMRDGCAIDRREVECTADESRVYD